MDIDTLAKLTAKAWSLRVPALMHEGVPGRQAPLIAASGAGRMSVVNALSHLEALGFLERTPRHGHPLRPEFRLTEAGRNVAPLAHRIDTAARDSVGSALVRKSWTVPVLAVTRRSVTFSRIRAELAPITDRALSMSLDRLHRQTWIERSVDVSMRPPRPLYRATNAGAEISRDVGLAG
ncbi:MAG: transcriptional regulator [Rhodobacterales bacterium]|nr:MAG: transcriptional regulator [Rhodobacterales bacterium]